MLRCVKTAGYLLTTAPVNLQSELMNNEIKHEIESDAT